MNSTIRLRYLFKALQELGLQQILLYASYQLGLHSGYYRLRTPVRPLDAERAYPLNAELIELPHPDDVKAVIGSPGVKSLKTAAEEILSGSTEIFGALTIPLSLAPPAPARHWSAYAQGLTPDGVSDIKILWEPARFGWAYTLGCAYHVIGEEDFAEVFWQNTETFIRTNPPNLGPQWSSAQEIALRLIALAWAYQAFSHSTHSTPPRIELLARAIAAHANRLPLTLNYARAQNNNHLLSEAAGLFTASLVLPDHPDSPGWRTLGMRWLNRGFADQITPHGSYVQHSANYHRLMLQLAAWVEALLIHQPTSSAEPFPPQVKDRLAAGTRWLLRLLDGESGQTPNLGPNDGAYIQPLSVLPFRDYRPALQSAALAFLGRPAFPPGAWDDLSLWLGYKRGKSQPEYQQVTKIYEPAPHRLDNGDSWAYLRAARFESRPGHADQLHLDLWWRGLNLARDPGTFSYNEPLPWNNPLAHTAVHNTLNVDDCDQMTRAGRFLWLDWAQATVCSHEEAKDSSLERMSAQHDGYQELGVLHRREVSAYRDGRWEVVDTLHPSSHDPENGGKSEVHFLRLHWLLPDWKWEVETDLMALTCRISSPYGWVSLLIDLPPEIRAGKAMQLFMTQIVRAGRVLYGKGEVSPSDGWFSPTYSVKEPALSVAVTTSGQLPLTIRSRWQLPGGKYLHS